MSADFLLHILKEKIDSGQWQPGTKLPTERDLASKYKLGRNTVRRALGELESSGRIIRHVGRGTFVAETSSSTIAGSVDASVVSPEEMMEARLLIEPLLAGLVVARASNAELEKLYTLALRGREARSMKEFEQWDNKLHRAIAQASKNQYLIGIIEGMHRIRRSDGWGALRRRGLTDDRRKAYQSEHEQIVDAIVARDAEGAYRAIVQHLSHVKSNLLVE
jgi:DNA-binding FadR family transcriptional regulator